ncbi:MAG: hypothetical protein COA42_23045 [Alteromonadaceae bacterium]|nr:MAG: hypothetical protein COA42_23045 [Alteromonadaceae bacterium]
MTVQQALREYLVNQPLKGLTPEGFDDDYDLIDAGFMDSLAIINTITYLEKHYETPIEEGDIVPENFMSVNSLCAFVTSKQTEQISS